MATEDVAPTGLWTVAVVAGAHALIEKGGELLKWLRQSP